MAETSSNMETATQQSAVEAAQGSGSAPTLKTSKYVPGDVLEDSRPDKADVTGALATKLNQARALMDDREVPVGHKFAPQPGAATTDAEEPTPATEQPVQQPPVSGGGLVTYTDPTTGQTRTIPESDIARIVSSQEQSAKAVEFFEQARQNPVGLARAILERHNVPAEAPAEEDPWAGVEDSDWDDPAMKALRRQNEMVLARLDQMDQQREQERQNAARMQQQANQWSSGIEVLRKQYGDIDETALRQAASKIGVYDPLVAYKVIGFDTLYDQASSQESMSAAERAASTVHRAGESAAPAVTKNRDEMTERELFDEVLARVMTGVNT